MQLRESCGATVKACQKALQVFKRADIAIQALYVAGLTTTKGADASLAEARQIKVPPAAAMRVRENTGADLAHCKRALQLKGGDEAASIKLLQKIERQIDGSGVADLRGQSAARVAQHAEDVMLGAHLATPRTGYTHHGIYVGDGRVVHYSGLSDGLDTGPVEEVDMATFAGGAEVWVLKHATPKFSATRIVERARSRIGESLYSVTANNCEHFCNWCIDDNHHSTQVDLGTAAGGTMGTGAAGLAARGIVSVSGAVAGTSGAGVMSGLASTGALVGGGAVAGIGLAAGAPALAMASLINNTILADNAALSTSERGARSVGRKATYVGAAGGVAGSIATISAAGTTAGLSGAGITSGLAAIGGTVGGGMATGVVIATAAPVAAAAAVGVGLYKLVKWLKD